MNVIKNGPEEKRQELPQCDNKYYLILDPLNSYHRRICYQEIGSAYGSSISIVKLAEDNQVYFSLFI